MLAVHYHYSPTKNTENIAFLVNGHCSSCLGKEELYFLKLLFLKSLDLKDKISRKDKKQRFTGVGGVVKTPNPNILLVDKQVFTAVDWTAHT